MEWIIKIERKKDRRILIVFDAMHETIKFIGQFKPSAKDMVNFDIKAGFVWIDISEDSHIMKIDLETLKEYIAKVYDKMEERLKIQEDLSKVFGVFKSIEIKED
ncbi:MAG: hypothetical protein WC428_00925 [Candidatus Paceibacterota bacterium]|jgi:hypothetical protein